MRSVIVIFKLASELASPGTTALTSAAHEALGSDVNVEVEVDTRAPTRFVESVAGDTAGVVWVTWDSEQHREAKLLCYLPQSARWFEEQQEFAPQDPEWERGRTLGYLIASIVLERPVNARPPASRKQPAPVAPPAARGPVTLSAAASAAGPGDGTSYGAWFGGDYGVAAWLSVGGFAEARFGGLPEADATFRILAVGPTATWHIYRPEPAWFGLRTSIAAAQIAVDRSTDDGSQRKTRFALEGDLVFQFGYGLGRWAGIYGELGGQVVSGKTEISIRDGDDEVTLLATLPIFVLVGRAGFRAAF